MAIYIGTTPILAQKICTYEGHAKGTIGVTRIHIAIHAYVIAFLWLAIMVLSAWVTLDFIIAATNN